MYYLLMALVQRRCRASGSDLEGEMATSLAVEEIYYAKGTCYAKYQGGKAKIKNLL